MPTLVTGQIYGDISSILSALRSQIIGRTGLDIASVFITRRKDHNMIVAENAVGIWVRGEVQDTDAVETAGRDNDMRMRRVTVLVYSRNLLDESDRDTRRLTDYSLGQLRFEDSVYDAIQLFMATNNQTELIVDMPTRTGAISDPEPAGKNAMFTVSGIDLEIRYNRQLSPDPDTIPPLE